MMTKHDSTALSSCKWGTCSRFVCTVSVWEEETQTLNVTRPMSSCKSSMKTFNGGSGLFCLWNDWRRFKVSRWQQGAWVWAKGFSLTTMHFSLIGLYMVALYSVGLYVVDLSLEGLYFVRIYIVGLSHIYQPCIDIHSIFCRSIHGRHICGSVVGLYLEGLCLVGYFVGLYSVDHTL